MTSNPRALARLKELALVFLKLGILGFGGPAAHIAMMEEEVVARRGWLTRERFLDLLGATNLIPGPNSTEMAIHLGYVRAGWSGLAVAGTCFILLCGPGQSLGPPPSQVPLDGGLSGRRQRQRRGPDGRRHREAGSGHPHHLAGLAHRRGGCPDRSPLENQPGLGGGRGRCPGLAAVPSYELTVDRIFSLI